jgi:hypothetical protein
LLVFPQLGEVLTDIKTFEQHRVYGFAITTANTIQTENQFLAIQWTDCFCIAFYRRTIQKLSHKSSENWYCSFISIFEIVLALKAFAKNKDCLGHRSKIKYRIRLSQYQNQSVLGKNIKKSI